MIVPMTSFLRNSLRLDALVSAAAGLLMTLASGPLSALLDLPQPLLFWAGVAIFGWVTLLVAVSRRGTVARLVLIDVVAGNALWVAASVGMLIGGMVTPNVLGVLFVLAQALAVAAFAVLQASALRAASPAHA